MPMICLRTVFIDTITSFLLVPLLFLFPANYKQRSLKVNDCRQNASNCTSVRIQTCPRVSGWIIFLYCRLMRIKSSPSDIKFAITGSHMKRKQFWTQVVCHLIPSVLGGDITVEFLLSTTNKAIFKLL